MSISEQSENKSEIGVSEIEEESKREEEQPKDEKRESQSGTSGVDLTRSSQRQTGTTLSVALNMDRDPEHLLKPLDMSTVLGILLEPWLGIGNEEVPWDALQNRLREMSSAGDAQMICRAKLLSNCDFDKKKTEDLKEEEKKEKEKEFQVQINNILGILRGYQGRKTQDLNMSGLLTIVISLCGLPSIQVEDRTLDSLRSSDKDFREEEGKIEGYKKENKGLMVQSKELMREIEKYKKENIELMVQSKKLEEQSNGQNDFVNMLIKEKQNSIKDKEELIKNNEKSISSSLILNRKKILSFRSDKGYHLLDTPLESSEPVTRSTVGISSKKKEEAVQSKVVGILNKMFTSDEKGPKYCVFDTHYTTPFENSNDRPDILILRCSYEQLENFFKESFSSIEEKPKSKTRRRITPKEEEEEKSFSYYLHHPGGVRAIFKEGDVPFSSAIAQLVIQRNLLAGIIELKRPEQWRSEEKGAFHQNISYILQFLTENTSTSFFLAESDGDNLNWRICGAYRDKQKLPNIFFGKENSSQENIEENLREMIDSISQIENKDIENKGRTGDPYQAVSLGKGQEGEVIGFKDVTYAIKNFLKSNPSTNRGEKKPTEFLEFVKNELLVSMMKSLKEFITPRAVKRFIDSTSFLVMPVVNRSYYDTSYTMERYERISLDSKDDIKLLLGCWGDFVTFVKTLSDKKVFHKDLRLPNVLKTQKDPKETGLPNVLKTKETEGKCTKETESLPKLVIIDWGCVSSTEESKFPLYVLEELFVYSEQSTGSKWLHEEIQNQPLRVCKDLLRSLEWVPSGGFCTSGPLIWGDTQESKLKSKWSYLHELEMFVGSVIYEFLKTFITLEANERGMKNAKEWIENLYPNYSGYYVGQPIVNEKRKEEAIEALEKVKDLFDKFASIGKSLLDSENGTAVNPNEKRKKGKKRKTDPVKEEVNNLLEKINNVSLEEILEKLNLKKGKKMKTLTNGIKDFIDNLDQFKRERREENLENELKENEKENRERENLVSLENALIGALYMLWMYAKDSSEKGNQIKED